MKLIIAGSRDFTDYDRMCRFMDHVLSRVGLDEVEVVIVGGARGGDELGRRWSVEKGIDHETYSADWDTYGKSAGFRRNKEMSFHGTHLVAFWDGKSHGTRHMIRCAQDEQLGIRIHRIDLPENNLQSVI